MRLKRLHKAASAVIAAASLLDGCASGGKSSSTMTGASTPRQAVESFLAAARSQDLQAMSVVWGTDHGPARDIIDRDVLEKREIIMVCFFGAEKSAIGGEATGQDGSRTFTVTLTKGSLTRQTDFTAVRGPADRWYVQNADILKVRDFCKTDKPDSLRFQGVVPREVPQ